MAQKPPTKKKKMTIEDFAVAIQADLARMATKDDLSLLATKEDLAAVSDRISTAKDEIQEQIAGLRYAKEIDALAERVKFVEQKLGIKHTRRAA